jgi:hypothetical protein
LLALPDFSPLAAEVTQVFTKGYKRIFNPMLDYRKLIEPMWVLSTEELSLRRAGTGFTVDLKGNAIAIIRHENAPSSNVTGQPRGIAPTFMQMLIKRLLATGLG